MPAKKKSKKKGDILARMSVDQRRQYLERKAAQELEKNRRREELLAGYLKLKLEDEQKKSSINEAKLNVKWRTILRQAKTESLVSQLKNLKQWIDEAVVSEDKLIQVLVDALREARMQRTHASQKHLSYVQTMCALHEEHLSLLTSDFRKQEFQLIKSSAEDIQNTTRKHLFEIKRLELVEKAAKHDTEREEELLTTIFENSVAAIKTKLEEESALAAAEEEQLMEDAWMRLATSLKEFEDETRDLREECRSLQEKVETNMTTKEKLDMEIEDMLAEISMLKVQLSEEEVSPSEKEEKTYALTQELLRNTLNNQKQQFREEIKEYNRKAEKAFKPLRETIHLGEEILHLSELCSRLETPEDKNLPFMPDLPPPKVLADIEEEEEKKKLRKDELLQVPKVKTMVKSPPPSDSGLGTSVVTNSSGGISGDKTKGTSTITNLKERGIMRVGDTVPVPISGPDELDPDAKSLPSTTLERIQSLIKDETLLKEMLGDGVSPLGGGAQPSSDYVMKETELVMRTHESLSHFWRKFNNVQVQRLSLKKEADDLERENTRLKDALRAHMLSRGISDMGLALPGAPISVLPLSVNKKRRSIGKNIRTCQKSKDKTEEINDPPVKSIPGPPVIEGNAVIHSKTLHARQMNQRAH